MVLASNERDPEGEGKKFSQLNCVHVTLFLHAHLVSSSSVKVSIAMQGLEHSPFPQMVQMFFWREFVLIF